MKALSRAFVAGVVALLPLGGAVFTVLALEDAIAGSWLARRPYYFPGAGLLLALAAICAVGAVVSSFLGRWLWRSVDRLLDRMPALGLLYRTLKQILGYGAGEDALFREVVLVPSRDVDGLELGLVTTRDAAGRVAVFLPGSPNPTAGRLVLLDASLVRPVPMSVHDALRFLVSAGKTDPPAA